MSIEVYKPSKAGTIAQRNLRARSVAPPGYVVTTRERGVPALVRRSLLLFVFTLPFENTGIGEFSVSKLCAVLFFGSYLWYYNPVLSKRSFPRMSGAVGCFLSYLAFYLLNDLIGYIDASGPEVFNFSTAFTQVQLVAFFWIASDLLREEKLVWKVLSTFAISAAAMAVGVALHVPGFEEEVVGRATALSENPNAVAINAGLGVVMIIGLLLYTTYKRWITKALLLSLILPLLTAMVVTGSRGGVLAFVAGCLVYFVPYWRSKRVWPAIFLVTLSLAAVVYMAARNPEDLERWEETYYEGDVSGRDVIYHEAIGMILERPIFGWNSNGAFYELGRRVGLPGRDPHNLLLFSLLGVGVVGTVPFLVGVWLCGRRAWRARLGHLKLLPLSLFCTVLATGLSGSTMVWKTQWLVFALTLAARTTADREIGKRYAVLARRPAVSRSVRVIRRPVMRSF